MECTKQAYGFVVNVRGKKDHIQLGKVMSECEILGVYLASPFHVIAISETLNQSKGTRNIVKSYGFSVSDVEKVFVPEKEKDL